MDIGKQLDAVTEHASANENERLRDQLKHLSPIEAVIANRVADRTLADLVKGVRLSHEVDPRVSALKVIDGVAAILKGYMNVANAAGDAFIAGIQNSN